MPLIHKEMFVVVLITGDRERNDEHVYYFGCGIGCRCFHIICGGGANSGRRSHLLGEGGGAEWEHAKAPPPTFFQCLRPPLRTFTGHSPDKPFWRPPPFSISGRSRTNRFSWGTPLFYPPDVPGQTGFQGDPPLSIHRTFPDKPFLHPPTGQSRTFPDKRPPFVYQVLGGAPPFQDFQNLFEGSKLCDCANEPTPNFVGGPPPLPLPTSAGHTVEQLPVRTGTNDPAHGWVQGLGTWRRPRVCLSVLGEAWCPTAF